MESVVRGNNHKYIMWTSISTIIIMIIIVSVSAWYWSSSSDNNNKRENKAKAQISKINNFKYIIEHLDIDKFLDIKKKNDLAVPEYPVVTQGIKVFSKVIDSNLGNGSLYNYSLHDPNKDIDGLVSNGITISVFPTFTQLAKILESVEQNDRLYFISEITVAITGATGVKDVHPDNPKLSAKINASMFSEKK